jgi:hypothetical protein
MTDSAWYTWVAGGMALVVVVGLVAGLGLGSGLGGHASTSPTGTAGAAPTYLYLTIAFNPVNGLDEYFPANFSVPAHTLVHVVITNYDNGVNSAVPAQYLKIYGVVGNVATWSNSTMSAPMTAGAVSSSQVAHTFTISSGPVQLNVPVPAATPSGDATTVSFSAYFNTTGTFQWNCMAPCDEDSMTTLGYMAGMVTVEPD